MHLLGTQRVLGAGDGGEDQFIHGALSPVDHSACISDCIIWFSVVMTFEFAW
jgi:hypothetical protein